MYAALIAVSSQVLSFLLSSAAAKTAVGLAVGAVITLLFALIISLLPTSVITLSLPGIHPLFWYLFDLFAVQSFVSAVGGAYATRFVIRRLPFVG